MNDPELKQMIHKALFAVAIALLFAIPVFFIFVNKISVKENRLLKDIRENKTFLLYVTENKCTMCKTLKKELDNKNISYKELNKDKEQEYEEIIKSLGLKSTNIETPTLIYVEKGQVISYIVDIKSKEYLPN